MVKYCRYCGKRYSLSSFLLLPVPKHGNISSLKDEDGMSITIFRDCSCGSTIAIFFESK